MSLRERDKFGVFFSIAKKPTHISSARNMIYRVKNLNL